MSWTLIRATSVLTMMALLLPACGTRGSVVLATDVDDSTTHAIEGNGLVAATADADGDALLERVRQLEASVSELGIVNDRLAAAVQQLEASSSALGIENERLTAEVATLQVKLDEGTVAPISSDGVFETFRGRVSIEDIYFELVDDEFEGIFGSRIDRLERCIGGQQRQDEVCGFPGSGLGDS